MAFLVTFCLPLAKYASDIILTGKLVLLFLAEISVLKGLTRVANIDATFLAVEHRSLLGVAIVTEVGLELPYRSFANVLVFQRIACFANLEAASLAIY